MEAGRLTKNNQETLSTKYTVVAITLEEFIKSYKERIVKFEELEFFCSKFGTTDGIAKALQVDLDKGPYHHDGHERIELFQTNQPPPLEIEGFYSILKNQLSNFIIIVQLVASVVSIVIEVAVEKEHRNVAWIDGFGIFVAAVIVVLVETVSDWKKDKQFIKLNPISKGQKLKDSEP